MCNDPIMSWHTAIRNGWHIPEQVQQWLSASMYDDLMVVKYDNQSEGLEVVGVDQNKFSNSCMQPYVMTLGS